MNKLFVHVLVEGYIIIVAVPRHVAVSFPKNAALVVNRSVANAAVLVVHIK